MTLAERGRHGEKVRAGVGNAQGVGRENFRISISGNAGCEWNVFMNGAALRGE
jgi:hypothetical protein